MKISIGDKKEFKSKTNKLNKAKKTLKKEFVGLDDVIDEVIDLIEPWYLFPDAQIRPTIINLWGMTGVGKTSLVVRLFEILGITSIYKFDIGDFSEDNSDTKLKYKISDSITKLKENDQFVLVFDEYQLGRTISENGEEINRSSLRILWELYDTGKIEIINSSYNTTRMYILLQKLEECVSNNVTAINGVVNGNEDFYCKVFGIKRGTNNDNGGVIPDNEGVILDEDEDLTFIPSYFGWTIHEIWENRFMGREDTLNYLKTLNEKQTLDFINETLEQSIVPTLYDFSNTVIFNIGNIDEAYRIANDINPDSDADFLYEYTKKITLPEIKQCLLKRYRPEQIARLGNNHVLYKSFNSQMYKDLIQIHINIFKEKIYDKFDLIIDCDDSVYDILYKEGVFPTQGTRPVFSTITSLIEGYTGKIISDIIKKDVLNVVKLKWAYHNKNHIVEFIGDKDELLFTKKYPVLLKTESLRENSKDDVQALVGLHEAGHAVCGMVALNLIPKHVVSRAADSDAGGFCMLEKPTFRSAELIRNDLIYTLGGYAAEVIGFGENFLTNGSSGDIESATTISLEYVKKYGMTGKPMAMAAKTLQSSYTYGDQDINDSDKQAMKLIEISLEKAKEILRSEIKLLTEIAKYLSENNRMDSKMLKEYYDKYAVNKVEFKNKENYYGFKEKLGKLK